MVKASRARSRSPIAAAASTAVGWRVPVSASSSAVAGAARKSARAAVATATDEGGGVMQDLLDRGCGRSTREQENEIDAGAEALGPGVGRFRPVADAGAELHGLLAHGEELVHDAD